MAKLAVPWLTRQHAADVLCVAIGLLCRPVAAMLRLLILALVLVLAALQPALAERRVALVIGNDAYKDLPPLRKAVNDARAVGRTLQALGYAVRIGENLDRRATNRLFADFEASLQPGDQAFVFFAGHGVAIRGENILLPVDMPKPRAGDEGLVRDEGTVTDDLVRRVQARGAAFAVFVIDACRDNPLAVPGGRSIGLTRGLARPEAPEGVLLIHSASPGEQALDRLSESDPNPNSVFTRLLVPLLQEPGLTHITLAKRLQTRVRDLARTISHAQFPDYVDRVAGEIVLNPAPGGAALAAREEPKPAVAPPPPAPALDETMWSFAESTTDARQIEDLIRRFPQSKLRAVWEARLSELKRQQTAALEAERVKRDAEQRGAEEAKRKAEAERRAADERRQAAERQAAEDAKRQTDAEAARRAEEEKRKAQVAMLPSTTPSPAAPAAGREIRTLTHVNRVYAVAFSPDGRILASGGRGWQLRLWNAATGQEIRSLLEHDNDVTSVAFSPDGQTLASGSYDKTIKLWNAATGRAIRTLSGHTDWVRSVAFSPDGRTLASGSSDRTIKLWHAATGRAIRTLRAKNLVYSVAFSPDGRSLAGSAGTVWDVATGREINDFLGSLQAFSPDGRTLAGEANGAIKLWDAATGREIRTLSGPTWVKSVAFSPDGRTLASGSEDNTIELWDVATGRVIGTLSGHADKVNSVAFSPDGRTLASGSDDHTIKLWEVAVVGVAEDETRKKAQVAMLPSTPASPTEAVTGREIRTLRGGIGAAEAIAFSPDGRTLAATDGSKGVVLWDMTTGRETGTLAEHKWGARSFAFAPDGRTLASFGDHEKTVKLWDLATGKAIRTLSGHKDNVVLIAFSPDGRTLASADDHTVKLWDAASGRAIRLLEDKYFASLAFSPDGRMLASGHNGGAVKLWDTATGRVIKTLPGHKNPVESDLVKALAFSPDGRTLASGGWDHTIKLWDVAAGREIRTLSSHTLAVWSIAFSPDGRLLGSAAKTLFSSETPEKTIKLWDVATGREIKTLSGHAGEVTSVAFSPDGRTLASGGRDYTVRLWEVAAGPAEDETREAEAERRAADERRQAAERQYGSR